MWYIIHYMLYIIHYILHIIYYVTFWYIASLSRSVMLFWGDWKAEWRDPNQKEEDIFTKGEGCFSAVEGKNLKKEPHSES